MGVASLISSPLYALEKKKNVWYIKSKNLDRSSKEEISTNQN